MSKSSKGKDDGNSFGGTPGDARRSPLGRGDGTTAISTSKGADFTDPRQAKGGSAGGRDFVKDPASAAPSTGGRDFTVPVFVQPPSDAGETSIDPASIPRGGRLPYTAPPDNGPRPPFKNMTRR